MNDLQCDVCGKFLTQIGHRDNHRVRVHPEEPPFYKCPESDCNARFNWMRELQHHIRLIHCDDYKCVTCGVDFKSKTNWTMHKLATHASYTEKLTHSLPPQPEGETYLQKIYYLKHESGLYLKIGITNNPMTVRLRNLKHEGETMNVVKSWILSEKFNDPLNTLPAEMLENDIIEYLRELGLTQRKREYFIFRNCELEEKLVEYLIETMVDKHEHTALAPRLPPVYIEHVQRGEKRKCMRTTNPTQTQLKQREYNKKKLAIDRGNYIYLFSNGTNVIKIGHTSQTPMMRLSQHNSKRSNYGKFGLVCAWRLGLEYDAETKRMQVEKRIMYEIGQQFESVGMSPEHFKVWPSQHAEVIAIINNIVNNL